MTICMVKVDYTDMLVEKQINRYEMADEASCTNDTMLLSAFYCFVLLAGISCNQTEMTKHSIISKTRAFSNKYSFQQ